MDKVICSYLPETFLLHLIEWRWCWSRCCPLLVECSSTSAHSTAGHRSPRLEAKDQEDWWTGLGQRSGSLDYPCKQDTEWLLFRLYPHECEFTCAGPGCGLQRNHAAVTNRQKQQLEQKTGQILPRDSYILVDRPQRLAPKWLVEFGGPNRMTSDLLLLNVWNIWDIQDLMSERQV